MQIVYKQVADLIPYVNNARKNDHAVDAVASSIKNYGFKQPIVIDSLGEVVAGHTRLKAAKKLGLKEVPVIIADDLTPSQVKAYRIADNRVGELAEWDMELLKLELEDIEEFTGFDLTEIDDSNFNEFEQFADKEKEDVNKEIVLTIKFETLKEFEKFQKNISPNIDKDFPNVKMSIVGGGI